MPRITCPHCGREADAPETGAPYFCAGCHGIVDLAGLLRPGQRTPPDPDQPAPRGAERGEGPRPPPLATPGAPPQYVSRYGTSVPREVSAPGPGLAAGGSLVGGLLLAALAAAVVGGGLGWLGAHQFRVPLLYAAVTGWAMRRALAIGGGGGTPDKGFAGSVVLLALCGGAYVFALFAEYDVASKRQDEHYREIFGEGDLAHAEEQLTRLQARDPARTGRVALHDGTTVSLAEEFERLRLAQATGRSPHRPFDVALLAATGRTGFVAWLEASVRDGSEFRFAPEHEGFPLPGVAVLVGWLVEFALLTGIAFARLE